MKWILRIGGGLLAIILLAVLTLLVMGRRADAGKMNASIEVNTSAEQLWPWLTEPEKVKQWVSWMVEIRPEGSLPYGLGAKEVWVMRDENNGGQLMEITGTITEYSPPRRLTIALSAPAGFDGDQSYDVTSAGNGRSRLDVQGSYRFHVFLARLMEPVIMPSAKKKLMGDLARLKTLAEAPQISGAAN